MQLHLPNVADRVLVVVDMQVAFWSSQKAQVLRSCASQIATAIRNSWAVLFLEYYGYGATDVRLRNVVGDYERFAVATKESDGGALEAFDACHANNWPTDYFRVCGVNTHACVYRTVQGLVSGNAMVEVWGPACNDHNFGYGRHITGALVPKTGCTIIGHKAA